MAIECSKPSDTGTIAIDGLMIVLATTSLVITGYGLYQYVVHYNRLSIDKKPGKPLFIIGLIFFIISLFTLLNALLYDIFYLVCMELDEYEGPIYHTSYFCQIYTLWLTLFFRLYFVFRDSQYRLSRVAVAIYVFCFVSVAMAIIPMYFVFDLNDAESYITLPYVALSILFNFGLMIGFLYKLSQLLTDMQLSGTQELSAERPNKNVIDPLLITMTKNTLLAVISISCTFLVIIVLIYLYIRNDGEYKKHSITEEFILEFAILVDIVSNFICVLLSYHFFDFEYQKVCKLCNNRLLKALHIEITKTIERKVTQRAHNKVPSQSPGCEAVEISALELDVTDIAVIGGNETDQMAEMN